jgi:hypothetical protein
MVTRKQLARVLAELVIVILGVMIALAADSWRQELQELQIESEYLGRLREDVSEGLKVLGDERKRFAQVTSAARTVIKLLESETGSDDDDLLVANFIAAAHTGFDREEMASDVTYSELVISGQLSLIKNHSLRERVIAYYRGSQRLASGLNGVPTINDTVGSLTGYLPVEFSTFGVELTAGDRARLLDAMRNDPELVNEIRSLHSVLIFFDREFEKLIAQGEQLLTLLD